MIRRPAATIVRLLLYSSLICGQLTGCERGDEYRYNPVPVDTKGPRVVSGPVENRTRTGSLNIGKAEPDGSYVFGEFTSGDEAYSVVIAQRALIQAGIKFDGEGRYRGTHTVVIASQQTFTVEPDHPDLYEIRSIKTP